MIRTIITIIAVFSSQLVYAESGGVDVGKNLSVLFNVAQVVSGVIGFYLFGSAVVGFFTWGKTGSQSTSALNLIMKMIIGTFMLSLGWFYQLIKASFIGDDAGGVTWSSGQAHIALDPAIAAGSAAINSSGFGKFVPAGTIETILAFVFVVGLFFFIAGVYSLKDIGDNRNSQSPYMKPSMQILGGMFCMNITWGGCIISSLLGIKALCMG